MVKSNRGSEGGAEPEAAHGQIARRHHASEALIYLWREKFFAGGVSDRMFVFTCLSSITGFVSIYTSIDRFLIFSE